MAAAAHATDVHGGEDFPAKKSTFDHFVAGALWGTLVVIMAVALLTVAFAMGAGWFPGLLAYVAIGAAAGFFMRMSAAWWAFLIGTAVLLGLGGLVSFLF